MRRRREQRADREMEPCDCHPLPTRNSRSRDSSCWTCAARGGVDSAHETDAIVHSCSIPSHDRFVPGFSTWRLGGRGQFAANVFGLEERHKRGDESANGLMATFGPCWTRDKMKQAFQSVVVGAASGASSITSNGAVSISSRCLRHLEVGEETLSPPVSDLSTQHLVPSRVQSTELG
jgi:hypothetical protein